MKTQKEQLLHVLRHTYLYVSEERGDKYEIITALRAALTELARPEIMVGIPHPVETVFESTDYHEWINTEYVRLNPHGLHGNNPSTTNELPLIANQRQEGGNHYSSAIQHWDFVLANDIPYMEAQVIRYVSRWKRKHKTSEGQRTDLKKAIHFLDKLLEWAEMVHFPEMDEEQHSQVYKKKKKKDKQKKRSYLCTDCSSSFTAKALDGMPVFWSRGGNYATLECPDCGGTIILGKSGKKDMSDQDVVASSIDNKYLVTESCCQSDLDADLVVEDEGWVDVATHGDVLQTGLWIPGLDEDDPDQGTEVISPPLNLDSEPDPSLCEKGHVGDTEFPPEPQAMVPMSPLAPIKEAFALRDIDREINPPESPKHVPHPSQPPATKPVSTKICELGQNLTHNRFPPSHQPHSHETSPTPNFLTCPNCKGVVDVPPKDPNPINENPEQRLQCPSCNFIFSIRN